MFNKTHPLRLDFLSECFQDKPLVNPLRGGCQLPPGTERYLAKKCAVKGAGLHWVQLPPGNWFARPHAPIAIGWRSSRGTAAPRLRQ